MLLNGWKYEGRKISDKLHEQILGIVEIINSPEKVAERNWTELQKYISSELDITPGQVRTIKRMMEEFDIVKKGALNSKEIPSVDVYTENGKTLIDLMETERLMMQKPSVDNLVTMEEIKKIYKLYYQKVMLAYCYNDNGHILHPLKATLKALRKYKYLKYYEWYLLNTFIRDDNNAEQEQELENAITQYRNGNLKIKDADIVENQLSHTYVLGNFVYAGFIEVEGNKPDLKITINKETEHLVDKILG